MPGEFELHRRTYMIWPQRPDIWRLGAKPVQEVYRKVAEAIAEFEPVTMLVNEEQYQHARRVLNSKVNVVEMSSNDAWARDVGATFVRNKTANEIRGIDWRFNAWGGLIDGLYFPWHLDDQVATKMCDLEHVDCYSLNHFILEGGSIHTDGEGTLIATESCLLSKGRNSTLTKKQIEQTLQGYLGVDKVIWLKNGIYQDETNGHVDNMCAFVRPGELMLAWTDDPQNPQYVYSQAAYRHLAGVRDARGRRLIVHKMPMPEAMYMTAGESSEIDQTPFAKRRPDGMRLCGSYINSYICNGAVIIPKFNVPQDQQACEIYRQLFPDRIIIPIYTREILLGGGNIHCITQQVPQ
jgi:agmatine deiminase